MIHLHYSGGCVLVFDVEDWITLRKTHRILGTFIGNTQYVQTLPLKLLPEEALLLFDKNLAEIFERNVETTSEIRERYDDFGEKLFEEEKIFYKNNRKRQLEVMIDDIVAAKRKHGDNRSTDEIFNDELEKSCQVTKENMIWPTLLTPLYTPDQSQIVPRNELLKSTSNIKYHIYKDLWEKGYFITTGHKFGADFLVYLGDPIAYHAMFILRCIQDPDESIHSTEIVAFGRLATAVKKRAVLASYQDNKVSYITVNWIDA